MRIGIDRAEREGCFLSIGQEDGNTCYQINEAESVELLHEWASNWDDVTDFTFIPVISNHEMSEKMKK